MNVLLIIADKENLLYTKIYTKVILPSRINNCHKFYKKTKA